MVDRFGRVADAVCGRSEATAASPLGDERLRSIEDVVRVGSHHQGWGLIAQVRVHPPEPGANRLGIVYPENRLDRRLNEGDW